VQEYSRQEICHRQYRNSGFLGIKQKSPFPDPISPHLYRIANPQPRVPEQQHKGPDSPGRFPARLMIEILKQITGSQDLLHFIGSKGKCGYKLYPRWLQRRGWVFEEPTGMLTETEENFQPFKVLQGSPDPRPTIIAPLPGWGNDNAVILGPMKAIPQVSAIDTQHGRNPTMVPFRMSRKVTPLTRGLISNIIILYTKKISWRRGRDSNPRGSD
jgi:hypothetical protein